MDALRSSNISSRCIHLIGNIFKEATIKLKLLKTSDALNIKKGVRQGDTILSKLFNAILQEIFNKINWDEKNV